MENPDAHGDARPQRRGGRRAEQSPLEDGDKQPVKEYIGCVAAHRRYHDQLRIVIRADDHLHCTVENIDQRDAMQRL